VHNHPSGDSKPSESDIRQTERLKRALRAVEITLMDHIIVAEDSFFSFADEKREVVG
jgi:DNA repair protein RadC